MASSSNNGGSGGSYQKYDGASGTYQPVDGSDFEDLNSNNGGSRHGGGFPRRSWRTAAWLGGAIVAALALGAYYHSTLPRKLNNQEQISKAIASSGSGLQVKSNGKLKLFDSLSK
jgi:hypothetical protein